MDENHDAFADALKPGDLVKEFSLLDQDGNRTALLLEDLKRPLAVVFYRGDW